MTGVQTCALPIYLVIVHELLHVVEPRHSRKFFRLLDRAIPEWRERSRRLSPLWTARGGLTLLPRDPRFPAAQGIYEPLTSSPTGDVNPGPRFARNAAVLGARSGADASSRASRARSPGVSTS